MSSSTKSGGIGIGTVIFWIIMWNLIFDDDDEKEVNVVVEEDDKQSITETVKQTVDNLKPYEEMIEQEDPKPKKESTDNFEQDDDLYGSSEDKY